MKLHPTLVLEYNPRNDTDRQFIIKVMGDKTWLGAYHFRTLEEAKEGFELAWNVFGSTCSFYNSLSEKEISEGGE